MTKIKGRYQMFSHIPLPWWASILAVLLLATLTNCGKDSSTKPNQPESPPVVTPIATRIEITPSSATLNSIGQTVQLTTRVLDQNNAPMTGAVVNWQSSNSGVATVNSTGLATAVRNGTAQITARSGGASSNVTITVMQAAGSIVIEPSSATLMSRGETVQLTTTVLDRNEQQVADAQVTWVSSNAGVATVSSSGLVTAVSNGNTQITARSGSASSNVTVVVMQSASSIVIEPSTATLTSLGETVQLTATVLDENRQPIADANVTWQSGDTSVATVSSNGLVTAVKNGEVQITAQISDVSQVIVVTIMVPSADRNTLIAIFNATNGPNWTRSTKWLSDRPIDEWFGVWTDAEGYVKRLVLRNNRLSGSIPPELGDLDKLEWLILENNSALSGTWPRSLTNLSKLSYLDLSGTRSCLQDDPALHAWVLGIFSAEGVVNCSDREVLIKLYNATDGPNWRDRTNWLGGKSLGEWYGVTANATGHVVELSLGYNNMTGEIPPELGSLSKLEVLEFGNYCVVCSFYNDLTGHIPPELGNLSNLRVLRLSTSYLTGSIPPELAKLSNLEELVLSVNKLTGSIPPELGDLRNLKWLSLYNNQLNGSIPLSLGNLGNLESMDISYNSLVSPIWGELGNLGNLESMDISYNSLFGRIPVELGSLTDLKYLYFHGNADLHGPLPHSFLNLIQMRELGYRSGTSVCMPDTEAFRAWYGRHWSQSPIRFCSDP